MSRTAAELDNLEHKLGKRGFRRELRPIFCDDCGERTLYVYALAHTNIGGRSIEICHGCDVVRSWRRPDGGDRVEDTGFDLDAFLG